MKQLLNLLTSIIFILYFSISCSGTAKSQSASDKSSAKENSCKNLKLPVYNKPANPSSELNKDLLENAVRGSLEGAKIALDRGADVRAKISKNEMAEPINGVMSAAVSGKNPELIQFLLSRGADIEEKDLYGRTPLNSILGKSWIKPDFINCLIGLGADVNAADPNGFTPLMIASASQNRQTWEIDLPSKKSPEIVKSLLKADAAIDSKNYKGETALMLAGGNPEVVRILIDAGADVHAVDHYSGSVRSHFRYAEKSSIELIEQSGGKWFEYVFAPGGLKMRSQPSLKGELIQVIPFQSEVEIKGDSMEGLTVEGTKGTWYRAVYDNKEGWIFSGFLTPDKNNVLKLIVCPGGKVSLGKHRCLPMWAARQILQGHNNGLGFDPCGGSLIAVPDTDSTLYLDHSYSSYSRGFDSCTNIRKNTFIVKTGTWNFSNGMLHLYFKQKCESTEETANGKKKVIRTLGPADHVKFRYENGKLIGTDKKGNKIYPPHVYC